MTGTAAGVTVLWLPLGAGGHVVAWNGRLYEALCARRERREPRALVHAALLVAVADRTWSVELAPAAGPGSRGPGVVATGPVGSRLLGVGRWFRYEVRRNPDGTVPDAAYALARQPVAVTPCVAHAVLRGVHDVPLLVWGRDEAGTGEMWNSNSVVAWLLDRAGLDVASFPLPPGTRAPGWGAGLALSRRTPAPTPAPTPARTPAQPRAQAEPEV